MKKLILVLSVATIGLNAANDWMSDLNKTLNDPKVQASARRVAAEAQKYAPTIKALGIKYGPQITQIAQRLENEGQALLAKVPAEHRRALLNQANNMVEKAAALAQAQAQNNPALVAKAKSMLAAHTKELDMIKARAVKAVASNPVLADKVREYVDKVKDAAGDSAITTYVNKTEDFVTMDVE